MEWRIDLYQWTQKMNVRLAYRSKNFWKRTNKGLVSSINAYFPLLVQLRSLCFARFSFYTFNGLVNFCSKAKHNFNQCTQDIFVFQNIGEKQDQKRIKTKKTFTHQADHVWFSYHSHKLTSRNDSQKCQCSLIPTYVNELSATVSCILSLIRIQWLTHRWFHHRKIIFFFHVR
jgi:hypothetical protein